MFDPGYLERNPFFEAADSKLGIVSPIATIYRWAPPQPVKAWTVRPPPVRGDPLEAVWFKQARGAVVYRGSAFLSNYLENLFIPDAERHVVHRAVLVENGLNCAGVGPADEQSTEFLLSTEPDFHPTQIINAPDGALIYYHLAQPAAAVSLEVVDASGTVVRHMSSAPIIPVKEAAQPPEPNFWLATAEPLPTAAGTNRINWDLRTDDPPAFTHSFEINANAALTPPSPEGPLVPAGIYTLRLTVAGKSYTQPVTVVNDPRSPATAVDVRAQYALQMKLAAGLRASWDAYQQVAALRALVAADSALPAAKAFDSTLAAVSGNPEPRRGGGGGGFGGGPAPPPTFVSVNGNLVGLINALENGDLAPTPAMQASYAAGCTDLKTALAAWQTASTTGLAALNAVRAQNNLKSITVSSTGLPVPICPTR